MKPGMHCLLALLRDDCANGSDSAEYAAALALAETEHVLPWVAACLRERRGQLSAEISTRVDEIGHDAAVTAFYWSSQLKEVLRAFDQARVRALPLKGPLLAERLYGNVALRSIRDLDILVSKVDLPRAETVLAANDFIPGPRDDYHRPWYRRNMTLELHHDVENPLTFDFHTETALRRAMPAIFQGLPCWNLAPQDELLFLCLHAARHRYESLSLVVDLQIAFEKLSLAVDEWQPCAELTGLQPLLTLGLAMARRLQPNLSNPEVIAESIPSDSRLEKLADRLWEQLLTQPHRPVDWRSVHAFFVEIESPGWPRFRRRLRHLRILASRTIDADYLFASRFGLRRTWQVRLLRPLRLLIRRPAAVPLSPLSKGRDR